MFHHHHQRQLIQILLPHPFTANADSNHIGEGQQTGLMFFEHSAQFDLAYHRTPSSRFNLINLFDFPKFFPANFET
jgi:hypothetical protein